MRALITGIDGFIGRNLRLFLSERADIEIVGFSRRDQSDDLPDIVRGVDVVIHLAGVNRPDHDAEFRHGNVDLTRQLCDALTHAGVAVPIIFSSSTQANKTNLYGHSKYDAEEVLREYSKQTGAATHIFRLPNVFGKWARPNYNSAVATFCHSIARGAPITINDANAPISLVYIDDVIADFISLMDGQLSRTDADGFTLPSTVYKTTVGEVADTLLSFRSVKTSLVVPEVGTGLVRALYSTYVSYLQPDHFTYQLPMHGDPRGVFVEMLKTEECGQFSYFTAHPGVTRGGHYHHSKTEKFLVIKGTARFKFRHMDTGEEHNVQTCGEKAEVVETVPGWTHDITNIGEDELVVMLWANEIFDRDKPDTYACPL